MHTKSSTSALRLAIAALLTLVWLVGHTSALTISYCSTQNTGADDSQGAFQYQSNGNCNDACSGYVFAILLGSNCYCSNYVPGSTVDTSLCNTPCPGYPDDKCGNTDKGYYGYIQKSGKPSGTIGASTQAAATTTAPAVTPSTIITTIFSSIFETYRATPTDIVHSIATQVLVPPTEASRFTSIKAITQTETTAATVYTTLLQSPATILSTVTNVITTQPDTQAAETTTTAAPTPTTALTATHQAGTASTIVVGGASAVITTQVVTLSGSVVIQTVTTMPTSSSANDSQGEHDKKPVSGGAIAGAAIGAAAGAALLVGMGLFLIRRRHEKRDEANISAFDPESSPRSNQPRRNVSVLSKMGLLTTSMNNRNSMVTTETAGVSPVSERRNSQPILFDQRLNPVMLMDHDNGSRTSVMSMADNRDYTRTLGVRNPDPRPSFDA